MTADDGRLYPSYISQGRDGPVYGRPQNMVDGTVRNTGRLSDVCGCEKNEDRLAVPLIDEQLRNFGTVPPPSGAWELLSLLQDGYPEGFLLAPPLGGGS